MRNLPAVYMYIIHAPSRAHTSDTYVSFEVCDVLEGFSARVEYI